MKAVAVGFSFVNSVTKIWRGGFMRDNSDKNIGEIADLVLTDLTTVEERLSDIKHYEDSVTELDATEALEYLRYAQHSVSDILDRYEEENGPI